ncbi:MULTISPECIES: allantoinase AllB [Nocardiopsis]|uniref:allantoinase n=1 Tax=Nocardiopsis dassonvillei (strain ATCC 23218 / DSM 43111 / CIP 107115 / JCM 7437 / KCTC 9190 / NBRC 14626 / NCTC 10488 / NRRL B-5397 / IMRU 509) TaxID=446468 RepID=D7AYH4_NOCDD|nr:MULTISPECIES: allantoinase AllB [Nocardiopsis]ADH66159.1 allantoinase [Nocardiopsis dassonvillei subsp. dassonvillei DSM 43111]NKY80951.1 allantoinase AllB [Nocardiopsis dassonvillei]VEI92179.1 Allantoinase [Nocardiopsis dassonvillei]
MTQHDLAVRARRALTPEGERPVTVGVRDGRVVNVLEGESAPLIARREITLAGDEVLLPGLVDTHVHVNEPGRTEWEGFATATRAAALGGITTLVDMPLNSVPPTTTVAGLDAKQAAADGKLAVDVGFWGGAVPENSRSGATKELAALWERGVFGFKAFLSPSGVEEFGHLSQEELYSAAEAIGEFGGRLIVHAEDPGVLDGAPPAAGRDYASFLASRPDTAENEAIARVIDVARATGTHAHVLHLSSASALPLIARARAEGVPLTVETCPHYLTLEAEGVPAGATQYKCCPPIRDAANRDLLWRALADGLIDCVVSDHSPSTPDLKDLDTGDFGTAWGGVSGLQVGFSAVWTEARRRGGSLADVVRWMSSGPARVAGLRGKGAIAEGADADFAVVAPEESFRVDVRALEHRNPVSPYDGAELLGRVRRTVLRGRDVGPGDRAGRMLVRG